MFGMLTHFQQPERLLDACQKSGVNLSQPRTYVLNIRGVRAIYNPTLSAPYSEPRFCNCVVEIIGNPPKRSWWWWPLEYLNETIFPGTVKLAEWNSPLTARHRHCDKQSCSHCLIDIEGALLSCNWFGNYMLTLNRQSRVIAREQAQIPAAPSDVVVDASAVDQTLVLTSVL